MKRVHSWSPLDQLESADVNTIQDNAAPSTTFVGYKRGGNIYTKANDQTLFVSPISLCIGTNTESTASNAAETSINVAASVNANAWHYAYAQVVAGAIVYTIGSATNPNTQPDAALVFNVIDSSKRYLGCFRTDGGSNILPFYQNGSRYFYRRSQVAVAVFSIVAGFQAAWTAQNLAARVPPHARIANVMVDLGSVLAAESAGVRTTGDVTFEVGRVYVPAPFAGANHNQLHVSVECDATQHIDIDTTANGPGAASSELFVTGFDERAV